MTKKPNLIRGIKTLFIGRKSYPPKAQRILDKFGHMYIESIIVKRTPIMSMIQKIVDKFGGDYPYDKLFHLRLEIYTKSVKITVEKNEVITVSHSTRTDKNDEAININYIPKAQTINDFMANGEKQMGAKFFPYNASNNNCQDFIIGLLQSNGINDSQAFSFIKQDTQQIFKNHPILRRVSNTATDIAGKIIDPIVQGGNRFGNAIRRQHCI